MFGKLFLSFCQLLIVYLINVSATYDYDVVDLLWIEQLEKLEEIAEKLEPDINEHWSSRTTGSDYFDVDFECSPKPLTVHQLRPQDIDVVGAMGDSITAGNGIEATTVPGIAVEDRGLSWTIGGEQALETALTIPNILRKFNPKVKGYSTGSQRPTRDLWFNAAVPGARARDMPDQARDLIDRMKNDSRTSFENDWKLISIFIGGNDLCALTSTDGRPEKYIEYLQEGLDILHAEVPRALVNVIDILEIYLLPEVGQGAGGTAACRAAQQTFCNYIVTADETEKETIILENKQYQNYTAQLIESGRYDTRDDFTVVLQPFLRDTVLPYTEDGEVDASFFAPDCFHFSDKGHAMGALNLWNNMLEPVGQKSTVWSITDLKTPTKDAPYIYTRLNSGEPANVKAQPQESNKLNKEEDLLTPQSQSVSKRKPLRLGSDITWKNQLKELENIPNEQKEVERVSRAIGTEFFKVDFESTPSATTVHQLRPTDIDVVGAMGDSLTAASGADANTIAGIAVAYRGLSWTIGGDANMSVSLTLPNILRNFNQALKGYSQGQTPGDRDLLWFNVAVPGARARDMPNQARNLIDRLQNDSRTNFENDWKVISIFIGGNDLCALDRSADATPEKYVEYLKESLDLLHEKVPRALINVIDILEIYLLPQIGSSPGGTITCRAAQASVCNYVVTANDEEQQHIIKENKRYQALTKELIDSGRYDTNDDFTVVLQPFLRDTVLPLTEDGDVDATFFAPDCFHFSTKAHAMGALNLWNNMLEPVEQKTTVWNITNLKCPTEESPYFFTRLNSGLVYTTTPVTSTKETPLPITTTLTKTTTKQPEKTTTKQPAKTTTKQPAKTTTLPNLVITTDLDDECCRGNSFVALSTCVWSLALLMSYFLTQQQ